MEKWEGKNLIFTGGGIAMPPIMIKFTLPVLAKMGLSDRHIYTSLENRMKCGVGKCGRLQLRVPLRLQGRARLQPRTAQAVARRLLSGFRASGLATRHFYPSSRAGATAGLSGSVGRIAGCLDPENP
jgi:hypothetical protein